MNDENGKINIRRGEGVRRFICWNSLWLLLYVAGFGVFFIGMPKYYDDYMYMVHLRPWFAEQGVVFPENGGDIFSHGIPWRAIFDTWVEHYKEDNIRIPNLMITFFLMFPKWFGSGIMTVLWGCTVVAGLRLAGVDWRRSPLLPVAMLMWMFFMPWRDYFGAMDYQFNYVLSSWIALRLLVWSRGFECEAETKRRGGILNFCAGLAFGLLAGMCHEGISVPVAAGLSVLLLCHRSVRDARIYGAVCGLLAGAALLLSVPGMIYRSDELVQSQDLMWVLSNLKMDGVTLWIFLTLLPITCVRTGWRSLMTDRMTLFVVVNILVSTAILCYSGILRRGCFWLDFISVVGVIRLLHLGFGRWSAQYRMSGVILAVPLLASVYVHQIAVGYWSLKLRQLQKEVLRAYVGNPDGYMFGDVRTLSQMPLLCGYLPDSRFAYSAMFNVRWYYDFGEWFWPCNEVIFPSEFRYVDGTQGTPVAGDGRIREISGMYYAPLESVNGGKIPEGGYVSVWMDFGKGYVHVLTGANVFRSERDGSEYVWLVPGLDWYVSHFKTVRGIRLTPPA